VGWAKAMLLSNVRKDTGDVCGLPCQFAAGRGDSPLCLLPALSRYGDTHLWRPPGGAVKATVNLISLMLPSRWRHHETHFAAQNILLGDFGEWRLVSITRIWLTTSGAALWLWYIFKPSLPLFALSRKLSPDVHSYHLLRLPLMLSLIHPKTTALLPALYLPLPASHTPTLPVIWRAGSAAY